MNESNACLVFVEEDTPSKGLFEVQIQFNPITITFTAVDFLFAPRLIEFIRETRGNPAYRDEQLGTGAYRTMPEKSIDLSPSFVGTKLVVIKDGEYDSGYGVHITPSTSCSMAFYVIDEKLDALLAGLQEIIDDYGPGTKDA